MLHLLEYYYIGLWGISRSDNHMQADKDQYHQALRVAAEDLMARFGFSLSINPWNLEWLAFGENGIGMGIVEFIALGSTQSFVVKIER